MIKLDVNNRVYTMDMDLPRRNRSSFQLAGTVSGQAAFDKPVRSAALCRGETAEDGKLERNEETELNGVEEERDEMSDEETDEVGEEDLAAPDWRVRAGPRNKSTQGRERNTKPCTYRSETGAHTA